ncbi:MAG: hypothetical protein M3169_16700 [Candidatus Eremiobacteraeota bacterium]|nr:hypothetical protein [Candidatus Eremiobacteraeota bacterium]
MSFVRHMIVGAIAGAAATSALNIATYTDIAVRGRGESDVPSTMVKNFAEAAGMGALASDDETTQHRRGGIGALMGYADGLGVGVIFGALRPALRGVPVLLTAVVAGAASMAVSDVAIAKSGASDPSTWGAADWAADAIPHLVYGLALALSFDALAGPFDR